ncbi:MAG: DUF192 domain-containing protein [Treponemataceae bacterium]|nr:DUF192 domain-containing protein [Treponemataceae bacterium]
MTCGCLVFRRGTACLFWFAAAVLAALSFCSCRSGRLESRHLEIVRADGGTVQVVAELARTAAERERGFMGRKSIPDGTGMLFLFDEDRILSFWMKDTPSPLSIAFISSDGRIRDIFDMTPFSLADVTSTVSVRYALEVPQGWFRREGVRAGDRLLIDF